MILQRVSPVTHSVGNCVKRVVVIVTSVLFFRTPVSSINSLGNDYFLLNSPQAVVMFITNYSFLLDLKKMVFSSLYLYY